MSIRLWHQSVTPLQRDSDYAKALVRRAETVLPGQVSVETFGLPAENYDGNPPSSLLGNAFMNHRILGRFIDQAITAERQGYDAFVVGSFADPLLTELRAAVDIPVVSLLETVLLVGCTLGHKAAVITTAPNVVKMINRSITHYRLWERVSEVVSVDPPLLGPVLHNCFAEPGPALERFERAARAALANGAEVLVPGEAILAVMLSERGITRLDGAPVLDVLGTTWSFALMQANLRRRAGQGVTRRGWFEQPNPELYAAQKAKAGG